MLAKCVIWPPVVYRPLYTVVEVAATHVEIHTALYYSNVVWMKSLRGDRRPWEASQGQGTASWAKSMPFRRIKHAISAMVSLIAHACYKIMRDRSTRKQLKITAWRESTKSQRRLAQTPRTAHAAYAVEDLGL